MRTGFWMATTLTLTVALISGCGQSGPAPAQAEKHADDHDDHDHDQHAATEKGVDNHSGWWCNEHGVPEAQCSQCFPKIAAEFQKKGDWCADHNRAKSQCFKCDPVLKEKFAAQYEAKYGKQPPTPEI